MPILRFIVALVWGATEAQLLLQTLVSFVIGTIYLTALPFSAVLKTNNLMGGVIGYGQFALFAVLFFGGNWITGSFLDYESWNTASITGLIPFVVALLAMAPQAPGKLLLARKCACVYAFFEASNRVPRPERIALARQHGARGRVEPSTRSPG